MNKPFKHSKKFKVCPKLLSAYENTPDHTYYVEEVGEESVNIWWFEDGEWKSDLGNTRDDYESNIRMEIWIEI